MKLLPFSTRSREFHCSWTNCTSVRLQPARRKRGDGISWGYGPGGMTGMGPGMHGQMGAEMHGRMGPGMRGQMGQACAVRWDPA